MKATAKPGVSPLFIVICCVVLTIGLGSFSRFANIDGDQYLNMAARGMAGAALAWLVYRLVVGR